MKFEDQVCSLELSKKLLELGIKNDCFFSWEYFNYNCYALKFKPYTIVGDSHYDLYNAYTAADLGNILPRFIDNKESQKRFELSIRKNIICRSLEDIDIVWTINYYDEFIIGNSPISLSLMNNVFDKNEANARAKMLIALIENGFFDVTRK